MKRNLVAHNQEGSSDKLYMFCIRRDRSGGYTVLGKWGRRGKKNLQQQTKLTTNNEAAAVAEQRRLFKSKLKRGYVDIESPDYTGPLSMASPEVKANLEGSDVVVAPKPKPPKSKPKTNDSGEVIVECVDNSGMEDKFDAGIEYVGEIHDDDSLVWVYDKLGHRQECFAERFKVLENA